MGASEGEAVQVFKQKEKNEAKGFYLYMIKFVPDSSIRQRLSVIPSHE